VLPKVLRIEVGDLGGDPARKSGDGLVQSRPAHREREDGGNKRTKRLKRKRFGGSLLAGPFSKPFKKRSATRGIIQTAPQKGARDEGGKGKRKRKSESCVAPTRKKAFTKGGSVKQDTGAREAARHRCRREEMELRGTEEGGDAGGIVRSNLLWPEIKEESS